MVMESLIPVVVNQYAGTLDEHERGQNNAILSGLLLLGNLSGIARIGSKKFKEHSCIQSED